jgi:hypothetical protein
MGVAAEACNPGAKSVDTVTRDDRLIADHVMDDPSRWGVAGARLREQGVPVWLVIDYARSVAFNVHATAKVYGLSTDAVEAAITFYYRHQQLIDAQIAVSSEPF